jgi:hypothetical protein
MNKALVFVYFPVGSMLTLAPERNQTVCNRQACFPVKQEYRKVTVLFSTNLKF